jgi:myo-inositol-1(or 4)-monophosphatase
VALQTSGGVTAAAVIDPFAEEVYRVVDGRAGLRRKDAPVPLTPTSTSGLVDVDLPAAGEARSVTPRLIVHPAFLARFDPRVISSTLAVVWVASGRRAAYVIDREVVGNVHFAAGCVVTDLRGGSVGAGPGLLVAADAATHAALLPMLACALDAA